DGGWGELPDSYYDPSRKGVGPSTAAQTAWALMGLLAAGDHRSPAVRRGVGYLLRTQLPDGSWKDEYWTGTGFPRVFFLAYHLYDDYFPLLALAEYARHAEPEGEELPFAEEPGRRTIRLLQTQDESPTEPQRALNEISHG
ncbi:MAG: hypothetical protein M3P24_03590, partial [Gemmatimonadota bacterium]|nr:hypothetical protein [Gemmatimonadota bacterium]